MDLKKLKKRISPLVEELRSTTKEYSDYISTIDSEIKNDEYSTVFIIVDSSTKQLNANVPISNKSLAGCIYYLVDSIEKAAKSKSTKEFAETLGSDGYASEIVEILKKVANDPVFYRSKETRELLSVVRSAADYVLGSLNPVERLAYSLKEDVPDLPTLSATVTKNLKEIKPEEPKQQAEVQEEPQAEVEDSSQTETDDSMEVATHQAEVENSSHIATDDSMEVEEKHQVEIENASQVATDDPMEVAIQNLQWLNKEAELSSDKSFKVPLDANNATKFDSTPITFRHNITTKKTHDPYKVLHMDAGDGVGVGDGKHVSVATVEQIKQILASERLKASRPMQRDSNKQKHEDNIAECTRIIDVMRRDAYSQDLAKQKLKSELALIQQMHEVISLGGTPDEKQKRFERIGKVMIMFSDPEKLGEPYQALVSELQNAGVVLQKPVANMKEMREAAVTDKKGMSSFSNELSEYLNHRSNRVFLDFWKGNTTGDMRASMFGLKRTHFIKKLQDAIKEYEQADGLIDKVDKLDNISLLVKEGKKNYSAVISSSSELCNILNKITKQVSEDLEKHVSEEHDRRAEQSAAKA
jgi:hypothetical protein